MGLAAVTWRYCVAQAPKCGAPGSPGRVHFGSGPAALDPIGPVGTRVEAILRPLPRIPVHRCPPGFLNGIASSPYLLRFSARQDTYPGCWYQPSKFRSVEE
jgi:hypothetical protein